MSITVGVRGQSGTVRGEWPTYGGDPGHTRYAPLEPINAENFKALNWRARS